MKRLVGYYILELGNKGLTEEILVGCYFWGVWEERVK